MEKGESLLKNERYFKKKKKVVDYKDKILPSSQPLTDFDDALSKASEIVKSSTLAMSENVRSPTKYDHSQTTGSGTNKQDLGSSSTEAKDAAQSTDKKDGNVINSQSMQLEATSTNTHHLNPNLPEFDISVDILRGDKEFRGMKQAYFFDRVDAIYDEVVHYRKNLFTVPSGSAGKEFVKELTFWIKQFNENTDLIQISLKVFMLLIALILQKPSAKSKSKDHMKAVERRLQMWRNGEVDALLEEIRFIQKKFCSSTKPRDMEEISKVFTRMILQGKLTAALKFLDKETNAGVLSLSEDVLNDLREKHPLSEPIAEGALLNGPIRNVPPGIFNMIDEQLIMKVALRTRGSAGPSGADANMYTRILCSKNFNESGKELREEIATMARNLATKSYHHKHLESYVASRLIPLNKNPGVRPIGVGEVLRRIIGKAISWTLKEEFCEAAGPLQTCAGHSAGAEAAIHGMRAIFEEEGTDAVLLIDASNAFNRMNRKVAMHNIRITCPEVSVYLINTYRHPSRLFISGGGEISSQEGTTQGDPLAMP